MLNKCGNSYSNVDKKMQKYSFLAQINISYFIL